MPDTIDHNLSPALQRSMYVSHRARTLNKLVEQGDALDGDGRAERARIILEIITERKPEPQKLLSECVRQYRCGYGRAASGMLVGATELSAQNATWYIQYLAGQ